MPLWRERTLKQVSPRRPAPARGRPPPHAPLQPVSLAAGLRAPLFWSLYLRPPGPPEPEPPPPTPCSRRRRRRRRWRSRRPRPLPGPCQRQQTRESTQPATPKRSSCPPAPLKPDGSSGPGVGAVHPGRHIAQQAWQRCAGPRKPLESHDNASGRRRKRRR